MKELINITEPPRTGNQARTPLLAIDPPTRKREPGPRPDWLKVTSRRNEVFSAVQAVKEVAV